MPMSDIGSLADQPLAGSGSITGSGTNWVVRRRAALDRKTTKGADQLWALAALSTAPIMSLAFG